MIDFTKLNVSNETKNILSEFHIDFVFQPIFDKNNNVYAYEALMRPENIFISDFIKQKELEHKLHEVELATFFGALSVYKERGYTEKININSFPSENLTNKEFEELLNCFPDTEKNMVIEILEYTEFQETIWKEKLKRIKKYPDITIALDDFGTGNNDLDSVMFYNPRIVKLDRSIIKDIHINTNKAGTVFGLTKYLHEIGTKVLAEGIELKEEYEFLKAIGIDYFQGFYLGRPN